MSGERMGSGFGAPEVRLLLAMQPKISRLLDKNYLTHEDMDALVSLIVDEILPRAAPPASEEDLPKLVRPVECANCGALRGEVPPDVWPNTGALESHPAPPATAGGWERVAREAWEEGREAAWRVAEKWANSKSCEQHDDNPCCHVRVGVSICNAIRALQRAAGGGA